MPAARLDIQKKENVANNRIEYTGKLEYPHTVTQQVVPFNFSVPAETYHRFIGWFKDFYSSHASNLKGAFSGEASQVNLEQLSLELHGNRILQKLPLDDVIKKGLFDLNADQLNILTNDIETPWELLCDDDEGFLALKYPISRIIKPPEAASPRRIITNTSDEIDGELRILFIGNPTVDKRRAELLGVQELPETKEEVLRVSQALLRAGVISQKSEILLGEDATTKNIDYLFDKHKFHVIHYSGHNIFDPSNPENNGLVLAGNDLLTPALCAEIFSKNAPQFIFMNACTTGTASSELDFSQQNPYSFIDSFCTIGISAFIGTLWMVEERTSAEFAIKFYNNLSKGMHLGEALQQAKKKSHELGEDRYQTWASFVLYGNQDIRINTDSLAGEKGPFKFLNHYTEQDQAIFKGREEETQSLVDDIRQGSYPIILLNGESGAGKSSILRAGIKPRLEKLNFEVAIIDGGYENLIETIKAEAVDKFLLNSELQELGFSDFLRQVSKTGTHRVIILDQFEKVFFSHFDKELRLHFFKKLLEFVRQPGDKIQMMLVMRSDFFPLLVDFLHTNEKVTHSFDGYAHMPMLKKLSHTKAEQAIREPLEMFGCKFDENVINLIIENLKDEDGFVYPPYLQVVCSKLYSDVAKDKLLVTIDDLRKIGDIQRILNDYLKSQVATFSPYQKEVKDILKSFITAKGVRELGEMSPAQIYSAIKESAVDELFTENALESLYKARVLKKRFIKNVPRYELVHDCLARTILTWMNDEEIEIKKAMEFLIAGKKTWINNNQSVFSLLDIKQLEIINSQRDFISAEIEPEHYDFLFKSAIKNNYEMQYWVCLDTVNIGEIDDVAKFEWIKELLEDKEKGEELQKHCSEALGYIKGKEYIFDFLWNIIFSKKDAGVREQASISLARASGDEAIARLENELSSKENRKLALEAISFIKNKLQIIEGAIYNSKSISSTDQELLKILKKSFSNLKLSKILTFTRMYPLMWKQRLRNKDNKFLSTVSLAFLGGLIPSTIYVAAFMAPFEASFLNIFWRIAFDPEHYFSVSYGQSVFLNMFGVAMLAFPYIFFANVFSIMSVKHKMYARAAGAFIGLVIGGAIIEWSLLLVAVPPVTQPVLLVLFYVIGVYSGLSVAVGTIIAKLFFGKESLLSNSVGMGGLAVLLSIPTILYFSLNYPVTHLEAFGEQMRILIVLIGITAGRGYALDRLKAKKTREIINKKQ